MIKLSYGEIKPHKNGGFICKVSTNYRTGKKIEIYLADGELDFIVNNKDKLYYRIVCGMILRRNKDDKSHFDYYDVVKDEWLDSGMDDEYFKTYYLDEPIYRIKY